MFAKNVLHEPLLPETKVTSQMAKGLVAGRPTNEVIQCAIELDLERLVSNLLQKEGIPHKTQYRCAIGRADIVSDHAIYEIKHPIDQDGLFKAVGQALMYRACINPSAKAIVAFLKPTIRGVDAHIKAAEASGVKVELLQLV